MKIQCRSARVTCRLIARGSWGKMVEREASGSKSNNRVTSDFLSVGRHRARKRSLRKNVERRCFEERRDYEEIVLYDFTFWVTLKKFNSSDRYSYRIARRQY